MNKHQIRTSETNSVRGITTKQFIGVNLKQTTKNLPFPYITTTISQRGLYEKERQSGTKFRLMLTVVPYCSNVLFNALTEIVKDEGSDKVKVITDITVDNIPDAIGKKNPTRVDMIANTEYSSTLHGGYTYHPGYDFFDNHILRNTSFKIVNNLKDTDDEDNFNTLKDFARTRDGEKIDLTKRLAISKPSETIKKHLYLKDDILTIDESINQNLYEENGWWGFINNTTIDSKCLRNGLWETLDISHALNNHKSCEFIDMYPDRTLFSFVPKYNSFRNRTENNWNIVITYPYKNIYKHPICLGGSSYLKRSINRDGAVVEESMSEGNRWTGLKVMKAFILDSGHGGTNIVFRTYTKHGLSKQDMFYLYYTNPYFEYRDNFSEETLNGCETYYESEISYKVTNIGDLNKNNDDYFFYISNTALLRELYKSYLIYATKLIQNGKEEDIPFYELYVNDDKKDIYDENNVLKKDLLNNILKQTNFRIRRSVNGCKSSYYLRLFRKVPNLMLAKRKMTDDEKLHKSKYNGVFDNYVKENASDPSEPTYQRLINNEQYKMAFAKNIYNDSISQISFIDGVDIDGLTDNLGRPLSEIYYTVIKNNAGHINWYEGGKYESINVEFSHCFGKVTSGLDMYFTKDDTDDTTVPVDYLKQLSSANHISNIIKNNDENSYKKDEITKNLDDDLTVNSTFFYGDLVEFNAYECEEHKLSNVMHRFNTAQREIITYNDAYKKYNKFTCHEITSDDYDKDVFYVEEIPYDNNVCRPEGYLYNPHYSIPIREFTQLQQESNQTLRIRSARPVQRNGILIEVSTMLAHNININDDVYICDDERDIRYVTKCCGVINKTTFLMSPHYSEIILNASDLDDSETLFNINVNGNQEYGQYKRRFNWLELCEILNGDHDNDISYPKLTIRRKNINIPEYATYIGGNQYIWKDVINIGDASAQNLPDYVFANGYFYLTSSINFFLKRQDPFGNNKLYFGGDNTDAFPNDPQGVIQEENNFIAKDTELEC